MFYAVGSRGGWVQNVQMLLLPSENEPSAGRPTRHLDFSMP